MKISQLIIAGVFVSSTGLFAGDWHKEYIAGGFNFAHGHAHDLTQKTWGGLGAFTGEFGIQFKHPQANVSIRPNFGVAKILGGSPTEEQPKIYDLMGIYVGADIVYTPIKVLPVSISTGPSFFTWNVDAVGVTGNPNQGNKDMKLGWRFGAGYDVNANCRVELTYTFTEWRTLTGPHVPGFNPSRPAYFCLKASYIF